MTARKIDIFLCAMLLSASPANAVSVAAEIVVSVPDQQLALLDRGKVVARYPVSTSKFGIGDGIGTYRTPLGTLFVSGKFGDHLASGAVIKSRVSRVIWLRGKEEQNRAAHDRCIYIHGTPEKHRVGKRASFGCIRMRSKDVIALYDLAHIGMHVTITQKRIVDLLPPEEPSLLARSD